MSSRKEIPKTKLAFIGGSSTFSINFPEDLNLSGIEVLERKVFPTPFGEGPEFKLVEIDGEPVLTVRMHGWRAGVSRADASRQLFWVLRQAGVKTILAEGGVGTIKRDLKLRHFIIPNDYIDLSLRKDVCLSDSYLLIMRNPICPELTELLIKTTVSLFSDRQVSRGVYVVTDGRHFESKAEVRMIESMGGDVIGQSLCPEVYLAREIGACYAGLYLVVNRAEGMGPDWSHNELKRVFYQEATNVGRIILESLKQIKQKHRKVCKCSKLRKKTLLKP
ncbi:MAG: MTAP family purine nucleoside phosphorylase [Nitrospirota bacterium]